MPWPIIATAVGVAVCVSLGFWQLGRGQEKRDLQMKFEARSAEPPIHVGQAELAAADVELRHVEARGVFDPRYTVYLDNRIHRGTAGYHVVMPLKVSGGDRYVLVNRGWTARLPDRTRVPEVRTPRDSVAISGVAVIPGRRILELSGEVIEGPIWQNLTIPRYREVMRLPIQPFVIRQESALDDGLAREWDAPDFGIEKHYGYAFQWFALAATLAVFYLVTHVRKRKARA